MYCISFTSDGFSTTSPIFGDLPGRLSAGPGGTTSPTELGEFVSLGQGLDASLSLGAATC